MWVENFLVHVEWRWKIECSSREKKCFHKNLTLLDVEIEFRVFWGLRALCDDFAEERDQNLNFP